MEYRMTPHEFCIWLSGFINASHHFNLTPEAFDNLKQALRNVKYENKTDERQYIHTKNETTTLGLKKEILND